MLKKLVNGQEVYLSQEEVEDFNARADQHAENAIVEAKEKKKKEIDAARDKILKKPYRHPEPISGKIREIGPDLLHHLNAATVVAKKDPTYKKPWICEDNDAGEDGRPLPMLSIDLLEDICLQINARNDQWIVEARKKKNEVDNMISVEQVENYVHGIPSPEELD